MTYFLFSDSETFNSEIKADTWTKALKLAKAKHGIKGKLQRVGFFSEFKTYRLIGSCGYTFNLKIVNE